jgi:hypothetical protein
MANFNNFLIYWGKFPRPGYSGGVELGKNGMR